MTVTRPGEGEIPDAAPREEAGLSSGQGAARVGGTAPRPQDATRPRKGGRGGRGDAWIWLTGSALGFSLLMIVGLIAVILTNGLGSFWPDSLVKLKLKDGGSFLGEVVDREPIPHPGTGEHNKRHRLQMKVGNRDLLGFDFKWIDEDDIVSRELPSDAVYIERREYGPLLGTPVKLVDSGRTVAEGSEAVWTAVQPFLERAQRDRKALRKIERDGIGDINYRIEQARLGLRKLDLEAAGGKGGDLAAKRAALQARIAAEQELYRQKQEQLQRLVESTSRSFLTVATADGQEKELRTLDIFRSFRSNRLTMWGRLRVYGSRLWEFVSGDPRESNTEGGIFPAIFGTVMMVLIMSVAAVPFGVLAALYLREYARQGFLVRIVRIAVNNLAGVPSIVFGVFGLGFFVYVLGGSIDRLFYPEALPTPTSARGGSCGRR